MNLLRGVPIKPLGWERANEARDQILYAVDLCAKKLGIPEPEA